MAIQNIAILTVLSSLGCYYSIQALVIRGVDIPRLNATKLAGKWFLAAEYEHERLLECTTSLITAQSDNSFTVNITYRPQPGIEGNNSNIPNRNLTEFIDIKIEEQYYIENKDENGDNVVEMAFDVDYDSHMAIYGTNSVEGLSNDHDGYIYIISRHPTLQEGIIERVEQTLFYKEGVMPGLRFIRVNASDCVQ